jgi:UDP-galactose transporter
VYLSCCPVGLVSLTLVSVSHTTKGNDLPPSFAMSKTPEKPPNFQPKQLTASGIGIMAAFVALESAVVLMVSTGKTADGNPPYNTSSIVLVVEFLKLVASVVGLWQAGQAHALPTHSPAGDHAVITGEENGLGEIRRVTPLSLLKYSVPGLLYAVNNNIFLLILTRMPPAVFQLLLNSRVVWTGLAFRWFMGRQLTKRQWFASFTLLLGCVLSQLGGTASSRSSTAVEELSLAGLVLTLVYCMISVSASVYNELLMKTEPSLHLANIQLYFCGVIFNVVGLMFQAQGGEFRQRWELQRTWVICSFQVVIGLLISRVMKNFDSIMKIFCVACSNLVVYAASVMLGTQPFTLQFVLAFFIVTWSGYRYSTPGE